MVLRNNCCTFVMTRDTVATCSVVSFSWYCCSRTEISNTAQSLGPHKAQAGTPDALTTTADSHCAIAVRISCAFCIFDAILQREPCHKAEYYCPAMLDVSRRRYNRQENICLGTYDVYHRTAIQVRTENGCGHVSGSKYLDLECPEVIFAATATILVNKKGGELYVQQQQLCRTVPALAALLCRSSVESCDTSDVGYILTSTAYVLRIYRFRNLYTRV